MGNSFFFTFSCRILQLYGNLARANLSRHSFKGELLPWDQREAGSVDGDAAAAMRYTEVRMSKLAQTVREMAAELRSRTA